MVGQKRLLDQIRSVDPFPRFVILTGPKGSGKRLVAKEISKILDAPIYFSDIKVEAVREIVNESYGNAIPVIYCFADGERMSIAAKNALLKITEEPPRQAYFILTLDSLESVPGTIKSRGMVFSLDPYSFKDLHEYCELQGVDNSIINSLVELSDTPGDINRLLDYDIDGFMQFSDSVIDNIGKVNGANAFKIANKIKFKEDGEGWEIDLFFKSIIKICHDRIIATPDDRYYKSIRTSMKYLNQIKSPSINRAFTFDMWILEMRGIWI